MAGRRRGKRRQPPRRRLAVIEDQQELAAVRIEPLDRVRDARPEIPEVAHMRALPYSMNAHSAALCQCSPRTPPAFRRMSTPAIVVAIVGA
jgi:hypothetical protein